MKQKRAKLEDDSVNIKTSAYANTPGRVMTEESILQDMCLEKMSPSLSQKSPWLLGVEGG